MLRLMIRLDGAGFYRRFVLEGSGKKLSAHFFFFFPQEQRRLLSCAHLNPSALCSWIKYLINYFE